MATPPFRDKKKTVSLILKSRVYIARSHFISSVNHFYHQRGYITVAQERALRSVMASIQHRDQEYHKRYIARERRNRERMRREAKRDLEVVVTRLIRTHGVNVVRKAVTQANKNIKVFR